MGMLQAQCDHAQFKLPAAWATARAEATQPPAAHALQNIEQPTHKCIHAYVHTYVSPHTHTGCDSLLYSACGLGWITCCSYMGHMCGCESPNIIITCSCFARVTKFGTCFMSPYNDTSTSSLSQAGQPSCCMNLRNSQGTVR